MQIFYQFFYSAKNNVVANAKININTMLKIICHLISSSLNINSLTILVNLIWIKNVKLNILINKHILFIIIIIIILFAMQMY